MKGLVSRCCSEFQPAVDEFVACYMGEDGKRERRGARMCAWHACVDTSGINYISSGFPLLAGYNLLLSILISIMVPMRWYSAGSLLV